MLPFKMPIWFIVLHIIILIGFIISVAVLFGVEIKFVNNLLAGRQMAVAIIFGVLLAGVGLWYTYMIVKSDKHNPRKHPEKEDQHPEDWK